MGHSLTNVRDTDLVVAGNNIKVLCLALITKELMYFELSNTTCFDASFRLDVRAAQDCIIDVEGPDDANRALLLTDQSDGTVQADITYIVLVIVLLFVDSNPDLRAIGVFFGEGFDDKIHDC